MKSIVGVLTLLLFCCSCGSQAKRSDNIRLTKLKQEFGQRYEISAEADLYLKARALNDIAPSKEEAFSVYRAFWLDGADQPRKDTSFVYLNVYNKQGVFQFQVFWSPQNQALEISQTEHY